MDFSTQPFTRSEFACRCGCGFDTVDTVLLSILEDLRYWAGSAVTINSGCRCEKHNAAVGGTERSKHLTGRAADVTVSSKTPKEVYAYLCSKYWGEFGIIRYSSFVHIDSRGTQYRDTRS